MSLPTQTMPEKGVYHPWWTSAYRRAAGTYTSDSLGGCKINLVVLLDHRVLQRMITGACNDATYRSVSCPILDAPTDHAWDAWNR
jgi:hypothetical protein